MSLRFGLEAEYHFSNNANDSSGNGNNGTVTGATITTDKNAVSNQAYDFNGTSDFISIPDATELNYTENEQFTLSLWFNGQNDGGIVEMITKRNVNDRYEIKLNTSNQLESDLGDGASVQRITDTVSSNDSNWHLAVLTYDGTTSRLYRDGILIGSDSTSLSGLDTNGASIFIGKGTNGFFNGKIDEVKIFSRALTQYEVYQLYYGYDTTFNQYGILRNGLDAEYHFSNSLNDSSGNGNNGTHSGTPTYVADKNAVSNQALDFNGTSEYVDTGFKPSTTAISISMWVKHDGVGSLEGYYTTMQNNGSRDGINFVKNADNTITFATFIGNANTGTCTSPTQLTAATWHHIVAVFDGTNVMSYINGKMECSGTASVTSHDFNGRLGEWYQGFGSRFFSGVMDEPKIFQRAITDTEVKMLYYGYDTTATSYETLTGDLGAGYHMSNNSNDFSGNGNNGTDTNITYVNDKNAVATSAADCNGTTSYIDSNYTTGAVTRLALNCWFNPDIVTGSQDIISALDAGDQRILFRLNNNMLLGVLKNDATTTVTPTGTKTFSASTWHMATLIWDNTDAKIYLDGVFDVSSAIGGTITMDVDYYIGARNNNGVADLFFDGTLDEVRMYTRELTEDEIIELTYGYDNPIMTEDAAAGYSNKVNGVTPAKINGIDVANISKFNGV